MRPYHTTASIGLFPLYKMDTEVAMLTWAISAQYYAVLLVWPKAILVKTEIHPLSGVSMHKDEGILARIEKTTFFFLFS